MAIKRQDPEFRYPDTVAYLEGLTDEEEAKHSPIVREQNGVVAHYWRGGGGRCRLELGVRYTTAASLRSGTACARPRNGQCCPTG